MDQSTTNPFPKEDDFCLSCFVVCRYEEPRAIRVRNVCGIIGSRQINAGAVALLGFGLVVSLRAAERDDKDPRDCGVNAIFVLLSLQRRPVSLDRIISALPRRQAEGHSMVELATASADLGLEVEGVRFGKGDKALEQPAIAFFRDGKSGHFAVLRPVGTTGTMVQVIDPPRAPLITDYDRLVSDESWTNRILICRRSWIVRNQIPLVAALGGCILLMTALIQRLRTVKVRTSATTTLL